MLSFRGFLSEAKNFHPESVQEIETSGIPSEFQPALIYIFNALRKEFDESKPLTIDLEKYSNGRGQVFFKNSIAGNDEIIKKILNSPENTNEKGKLIYDPYTRTKPFSDGSLGVNITAADWEQVICVAWNKKVLNLSDDDAKKRADILNWKEKLDPKLLSGAKIVDSILKKVNTKRAMKHFGSSSEDVSQQWMKYVQKMRGVTTKQPAAASRTPKTDMFFENGDRISLKKSGGSQLMSGKDFETLGTISVALDKCREQNFWDTAVLSKMNKIYSKIENEIKPRGKKGFITHKFEGGFETMSGERGAQSQMTKVKNLGWQQIKGFARNDFLDWVIEQTNMQDRVQESLDDLLSDPRIKKTFSEALTHEAMSGTVKFGANSPATATHVLIFKESGEGKYTKIDDTYVADVASNVNWQVKFKTSGTGKAAWTALKGIFSESFEELGGQYLSEQDLLDEGIIWNFIKKWFKKVWNKIAKIATQSIEKLMELFGIKMQFGIKRDYTFV
ncbi:hypothetical protein CL614_09585 [archaeon]|nr:hypothetical protein [archaeon]|tara:strand:- start:2382 stop:3890 length:1509 start_codon:yes stop_codon:yes gene_type:complete